VLPLGQLRSGGTLALELALGAGAEADLVDRATQVLRASPGAAPVYVTVVHGGHAADAGGNGGNGAVETVRLRSRSLSVLPTETLLSDLRELFGSDRIRLVRS
jgi:hypothetical protein